MALTKISEQTASGDPTIEFEAGIDSTYKLYIFKYINIHPATDAQNFGFQGNASGQSDYDEYMTTTAWNAYHREDDGSYNVTYQTGEDQAQGTALQPLCNDLSNDADSGACGDLLLFNPSNTTYVKHFIARTQMMNTAPATQDWYIAGYFNVTAAITQIQFKMASGNIDTGTIQMWGL